MNFTLWMTGILALLFAWFSYLCYHRAEGEGDGGFGDAAGFYVFGVMAALLGITWIIVLGVKLCKG